MKQSQKQVVNVIINNDKCKRKYRRHKHNNNETQSNSLPISYYNPNIISYNRQPSYGLSSINPILQEDPNITNILNKIQTLEPNIDEYKQMINQPIHNNFQDITDTNTDTTSIFDFPTFNPSKIPSVNPSSGRRGRPSQPIHTLTRSSALSKYYRLKNKINKTSKEISEFNDLKLLLNK